MLLKGKVAVVTGSTKGIGFAIAKEFAENNGATTIVCSRIHEQAEKAIKQIRSGKVFAAEIDVTNNISVKKFMGQILSKFGRIDILVNNAGYPFDNNIWYKKFHEVTDEGEETSHLLLFLGRSSWYYHFKQDQRFFA